eukprot:s2301_g6.t1
MLRPSWAPSQPPVTLVNGTLGKLFASACSARALAFALALAFEAAEGRRHGIHRRDISAGTVPVQSWTWTATRAKTRPKDCSKGAQDLLCQELAMASLLLSCNRTKFTSCGFCIDISRISYENPASVLMSNAKPCQVRDLK